MTRAGPDQARLLAALHEAAFPPGQGWGADAIAMQLALPGAFALLDERGGMVIARVAAGESEILTLAVVLDCRRRGVGTALLKAAMAQAARFGAGAMYLEVSSENAAAQPLYAGAGFSVVGSRPRYYPDGSDALVLRASLMPGEAVAG